MAKSPPQTPSPLFPMNAITSRHTRSVGPGALQAEVGRDGVAGHITQTAPSAPGIEISVIMPTVFWSGTVERCGRRVLSILDSANVPTEVVFVFDGSPPPPPAWLDHPKVTIVATGTCSGPAIARNLAAQAARGKVLFFVDADVELATDAIARVRDAFDADPDLVSVFGAYDDDPADKGVVSTFRNLLHHHTHVAHPGRAGTFWSGCGAIRTPVFLDIGGFDESYAYPSVEDIELGMRIASNGGRIAIDPRLQCKHLKRWTLASMIVTDIVHRARPWTHLIMTSHHLPTTLNLDWRGRLSGACSVLLVGSLAATAFAPIVPWTAWTAWASWAAWAAIGLALVVIAMNHDFYRLCLKKRGVLFAVMSFVLHVLYFFYASITFGTVVLYELWFGSGRSSAYRPLLPLQQSPIPSRAAPSLASTAAR